MRCSSLAIVSYISNIERGEAEHKCMVLGAVIMCLMRLRIKYNMQREWECNQIEFKRAHLNSDDIIDMQSNKTQANQFVDLQHCVNILWHLICESAQNGIRIILAFLAA